MEPISISSLDLYKSFRLMPFSIFSALSTILENSINNFLDNNNLNEQSITIIYLNLDEGWLQIMDNSKGTQALNNIWHSIDKSSVNNKKLIPACFWLSDFVTIESKNGNQGFSTSLDLNNPEKVCLEIKKNDELLRIFNTGTRITLNNILHEIKKENVHEIYNYLSFCFNKIITKYNPSIYFAVINDGLVIDPSSEQLNVVQNISQVNRLFFKLPEHNSFRTINKKINLVNNKKNIEMNLTAYQILVNKKWTGISIANQNKVIIGNERLFRPDWFNQDYNFIYVDIELIGVDNDLFDTKFFLEINTMNEIESIIKETIEPIKLDLPKTLTKPLIDSNDVKYHTKHLDDDDNELMKTKKFLTSMFNNNSNQVDEFEITEDKLRFNYNADDGKKITINLIKDANANDDWLQLIPVEEKPVEQIYEYNLKFNINHPYFKEFSNDEELTRKIEHFAISYGLAECITRLDGSSVGQLKYEIDKILRGSCNE